MVGSGNLIAGVPTDLGGSDTIFIIAPCLFSAPCSSSFFPRPQVCLQKANREAITLPQSSLHYCVFLHSPSHRKLFWTLFLRSTMALATEGATNSVEAWPLAFWWIKIIKRCRVRVTDVVLVDNLGRVPYLVDYMILLLVLLWIVFLVKPVVLPKDHYSGHFGHIELVAPVYNPLIFTFLGNIIKKTCFSSF